MKFAIVHTIGFFVHPGHPILDLAGPSGAFESIEKITGRPFYALEVLSRASGLV
ncbi:hypothetical protein [Burkholderia sp. BCC0419]|uniref:hypothetical protein n=1 Tax=Burkholderia sp. BCC0419 TaxID=486878 RepID=UPI00158D1454|nr:hypothetical protein [Burkholderia sp. BCC0419]